MQRIALLIEYDGTRYAGWQRQSNGVTVQQHVEQALTKTFGHECIIHGAGRTDAGVHASGQVAHTQLYDHAHRIPLDKVPIALNTRLPFDIRIKEVAHVSDNFHARFDAIWREYVYTITTSDSVFQRHFAWNPKLPFQTDLLRDALNVMLGEHDFTAISKHNPATTSYVCTVQKCEMQETSSQLMIRIRANRFVYGMCRAMVGVAMSVARKRITVDDLTHLLQSRVRERAPIIVPAHGLNLESIGYANNIFHTIDPV
jgi:tRNA pseudouridine38-40 synthase